jgi:hypothetical protein
MMCRKTLLFRQTIRHDFRLRVAKARRRADVMDMDITEVEIAS